MKKEHPGKWRPGTSGNPAGRKPGSGQVAKLRAGISEALPGIIDKLVAQALAGDTAAARLLLERCVAPLKAAEAVEPVNLAGDSLTEQGRAVLAAVAAGELAPGQAAALLAAIGSLAHIVEIDALAARLDALENRT